MTDRATPGATGPRGRPELSAAFCDAARDLIKYGMSADEVVDCLGQVVEVIAGDVADLRRKSRIAGGAKEETKNQPTGGIVDESE